MVIDRIICAMRASYLRHRIRAAERDLQYFARAEKAARDEHDAACFRAQASVHRREIEAWSVSLILVERYAGSLGSAASGTSSSMAATRD